MNSTPFHTAFAALRTITSTGVCTLAVFVSGCASIHEGAYVGNGGTCDAHAHAEARPTSSVPLFASRDVKEDARNRVAMERSTGRPVAARPATVNDVIGWHQSGVCDANIINHIRIHGLYQPLQSQDVLNLQNHGISVNVIRTMKEHPYPNVDAPVPPPRSMGSSFTKNSRNPDTNPGNGYYAGSGNSGPEVAPASSTLPQTTVAPPVTSAGNGKPRLQSVQPYTAFGTYVGETEMIPCGEVIYSDCECFE